MIQAHEVFYGTAARIGPIILSVVDMDTARTAPVSDKEKKGLDKVQEKVYRVLIQTKKVGSPYHELPLLNTFMNRVPSKCLYGAVQSQKKRLRL